MGRRTTEEQPLPRQDAASAAESDPAALAARAQRGDRDAFEALYRLRAHDVARYVTRILHGAAESEDVTAEAFLQAWKGIRSLRDPARFDAWLFRIAHHVAMNQLRRPQEAVVDELPEPADPATAGRPDMALESKADAAALRRALLALPDRYREVLVLRHFAEKTDAEVAHQLATTEGNVRVLRSRAMKRLRELLQA